MSTPRDIEAKVPQKSVLSLKLYNLYLNNTPQSPAVCLGLFADDTCINATDRKNGYKKATAKSQYYWDVALRAAGT
jgi:hypothetical protein